MLQITARLFKDGQLVGYRLTDGNQTQDLTKIQTWMYAKNKKIINVTAAGTQEDPQLSGNNGFELKGLPKVGLGKPVTYSDTNPNRCKYSNSLLITNFIVDSNNPRRDIARNNNIPIGKDGKRALVEVPITVGYVVKNIGKEPISIERLLINANEKESVVIYPNQTVALSHAETILLAFRIELDGNFANAKLVSSKTQERTLENVRYFYVKVTDDGIDTYADGFRQELYDVVKHDEIFKYFIPESDANRKKYEPLEGRMDEEEWKEIISKCKQKQVENANNQKQAQRPKGFFDTVVDSFNRFRR